jgi:hypothetical protein
MTKHTPECEGLNAGAPGVGCICESIRAKQRVQALILPESCRRQNDERLSKREWIFFAVVVAVCFGVIACSLLGII